jgi:hypothetical protein
MKNTIHAIAGIHARMHNHSGTSYSAVRVCQSAFHNSSGIKAPDSKIKAARTMPPIISGNEANRILRAHFGSFMGVSCLSFELRRNADLQLLPSVPISANKIG